MAGFSKLFSSAEDIGIFYTEPMGYGAGFMYAIGAVEAVAAVALIVGYWKRSATLLASALLTVVMIGAVASTSIAGMGAAVAMPAIYLVMSLLVFFGNLRPRQAVRIQATR
jgi:uncharacterized membrane protein YphA (DoxX/SURF4 family)